MKKLYLMLISLILFVSCDDNIQSITEIVPVNHYIVSPALGKLPFPQHNPQFTSSEYNKMISQLWIINNFGLWQGGTTNTSEYFHDGFDIVLPNGTKIYAVKSGYVRAIIGGSEYYNTLIIEDKNELGYGWSYTHTYYFNVKVGDEVMRGDLLSVVHFQGLEHIHLTRVKLVSGGSWSNLTNLESMMPDEYFQIPDSIPPVIQTPFYYFKDNTNVIIDNSAVPMLSGKVDIVVGMREAGEYEHGQAGSLAPGFGDRNCVNRIEYEILSGQNVIMQKRSFDFSKVTFIPGPDGYKKVDIAYKPYYLFEPERNYWSKVLSYFIITNWDENHQLGQFSSADEAGCWDTSELNSDGSRRFPNGSYTVKVIAYDFAGNSSSNEQNVTINN